MAKNNTIKGFGNILVGVTLGGVAMGSTGSLGAFSGPTQSMIGLGILGTAIKPVKNIISKW